MKKILLFSLIATMSSSLWAYDSNERNYKVNRVNKEAQKIVYDTYYEDMAPVTRVTPNYETVNKPREVCRKQIVQETIQGSNNVQGGSSQDYTGAIIGGLAGGILGNQVGGGTGKDIATAAGAVTGALIGSNIANKNKGNAQQVGPSVVEKEKLVCENENNYEKIITGYNIEYTYNGRTFETFSDKEPVGRKILVKIFVQPIE